MVSVTDFNVRDIETGTETWLTPRWILDPLGEFDLDPCAHPQWQTAKELFVWPNDDGLMLPWVGRVWCNPPYGTQSEAWAERMANHRDGYLLIFARTETQMFRRMWETADAMFFFEGRVRFVRANLVEGESAPAPSVLLAFGRQNADKLNNVAWKGSLVTQWRAQ